ncbi:mechanosensitive ion channel family protein [Candidatus Enterococcus leclercqii]|uniref:mechanosensitive ion channel family protein n=1 Tax=Candidatus Enterococcus leclercqii TaxID=1857218 RepID=UPI00137B5FFA|nr:mechanosensitive ion channel family protein [Enterococcus sp. CU9D]
MTPLRLLTESSTTDSTGSKITEPAAKQLNALQRWWSNIDWEAIAGSAIQKGLMLLFLLLLFAILFKVGDFLVDRSYRSYQKRDRANEGRVRTIHTLMRNVVHYTLGFFFVYSVLSTLGVPVGSLLAGAGIAGLAIGLGAQGFMNDIITGFFIILEQQVDVGDYVVLQNLGIEGTVIAVGIRTLELRSLNGTVHFIPNRNITTISNNSRADMQVIVDVRILPAEGLDKIREVVEKSNSRLAALEQQKITTPPVVFGLVDIGGGNYVIRTTFYAVNGSQGALKEEFLAAGIDALTEAGFTIPTGPVTAPLK